MKIATDVLVVLEGLKVTGNQVVITQQLPRNLYLQVNAVLNAAGGKWDKKAKAHLFPGEIEETLEHIVASGEVTVPASEGFFPTPQWLAEELVDDAQVTPGMSGLEPSAGTGAIALAMSERGIRPICIEKNHDRAKKLRDYGFTVATNDFLEMQPDYQFDRVIMNPPFAKQADIIHVTHALKFLNPGGMLVAIMGKGVTFRADKRAVEFRNLVESRGGLIDPIPEGAFKESGTMVNTVKVRIPG